MTTWRTTSIESSELFSPKGVRLLDELTGQGPLGDTTPFLDIREPSSTWRQTEIKPVRTIGGVIAYPGLGRHPNPSQQSPRRYRIRLEAQYYIPLYRRTADGIEFDAYPYNNTNPPQVVTRSPTDTFLTPAPNYPFPSHVPVLRGIVKDTSGKPVRDVVVTQGMNEIVVTDARGVFALPLRWVPQGVVTPIDAADERKPRVGTINVTLPDALGTNQVITIL